MKNIEFYTCISEVNREKWVDFYKNHDQANAFQTIEMFEFWGDQKNYKSFIFFLEASSKECLGFCTGVIVPTGKSKTKNPNRSALIYGGPLVRDDNTEILKIFLEKIGKYLKFRSKYIEFRNFRTDLILKETFTANNWKYTPKLNYFIQLDSEEEVYNNFDSSRKREIRRAVKEGVEISYDKSPEKLREVYNILSKVFKINDKVMALPIPDLAFLSNLLELDNSRMISVIYNNKIIGGGFFIYDKNRIYHWFRAGLNREYSKQSPDAMVDWEVMKFGLKHKIAIFDYMGAGTKGQDNRLRTYKSRFGGELVEIGMYSRINFPLAFRIENKITKTYRKYKLFDR